MEKLILLILLAVGPTIFKGEESNSLNNLNQNTVFHEIQDTSNVTHWYTELRDGELYCYKHSTWEHMEIRNSSQLP